MGARGEPVTARTETVATRAEPVIARAEPVIARAEPVIARGELVIARAEPVADRPEPARPSVGKGESERDLSEPLAKVSAEPLLRPELNATPAPALSGVLSADTAAPVESTRGPGLAGMELTELVRQVNRTLAQRDLDALQSGREVVLRLDDARLPQTALVLRPQGGEMVASLQTQSAEVQQFLDVNLARLVAAMAAEVPGLRWVAPELAVASRPLDPAGGASDQGGAPGGQGSGQGGSGGDGQGRPQGGSAEAIEAAASWDAQSQSQRAVAAAAFGDALSAGS
jgi:hypothetical protein